MTSRRRGDDEASSPPTARGRSGRAPGRCFAPSGRARALRCTVAMDDESMGTLNGDATVAGVATWLVDTAFDRVIDVYCKSHRLSGQEKRLLAATAAGKTEKEVAAMLDCQRSTISTYWQRIFKKIGRRSQIEVLGDLLRWVVDGEGRRLLADAPGNRQV
jgi:DNA-binding CsgD family transcriptional regulator